MNLTTPPDDGNVLIVDDVSVNRDILAHLLAADGFRCRQAADVPGAKRVLEDGDVHAVLLDLDLGHGPGGMELLRWMRANGRHKTTPVIVVTGTGTGSDIVTECLAIGAAEHIRKPFDPRLLRARVSRVYRDAFAFRTALAEADRVQREISAAAEVQRGLTPEVPSRIGPCAVTGAVIPSGPVSGDCFDTCEDANGRASIIVVDAAGHGTGAGVLATAVMATLRIGLETGESLDRIAQAADAQLRRGARMDGANASAIIARVDAGAGVVEVLNAGMPPMLHWTPNRVEWAPSLSPPIGFPTARSWTSSRFQLESNESVLLFCSDGTLCGEVDRESVAALAAAIGLPRFGRLLAAASNTQLEALMREYIGPSTGADDATLVLAATLGYRQP